MTANGIVGAMWPLLFSHGPFSITFFTILFLFAIELWSKSLQILFFFQILIHAHLLDGYLEAKLRIMYHFLHLVTNFMRKLLLDIHPSKSSYELLAHHWASWLVPSHTSILSPLSPFFWGGGLKFSGSMTCVSYNEMILRIMLTSSLAGIMFCSSGALVSWELASCGIFWHIFVPQNMDGNNSRNVNYFGNILGFVFTTYFDEYPTPKPLHIVKCRWLRCRSTLPTRVLHSRQWLYALAVSRCCSNMASIDWFMLAHVTNLATTESTCFL